MERAFHALGEPFDVVCYIAEGEERGKFLHTPPDAETRLIERPNEYRDLALDERPVLPKIRCRAWLPIFSSSRVFPNGRGLSDGVSAALHAAAGCVLVR